MAAAGVAQLAAVLRQLVEVVAAPRADVNAVVESIAMTLAEHVGDRAHDDIAILGVQNAAGLR